MNRQSHPASFQLDAYDPDGDRRCSVRSEEVACADASSKEALVVPLIVSLQRANRGQHFRAFSLRQAQVPLGPILGVDHAWMSAPTFPAHSHQGIAVVSYLFLDSETGIDNQDSLGNRNLIRPGALHWTSAGTGIVHEEVPAQSGKTVHLLQVFVALADEQLNAHPATLSIDAHEVPVVDLHGVKVRVPLGTFRDTTSPLTPPTAVNMFDILLEDGGELSVSLPQGHCAFVIPVFGAVWVNGLRFERDDLKLPVFAPMETGGAVTLRACHGKAKAVVFSGKPLLVQGSGEPR